MTTALIGYTGFVGGILSRHTRFDDLYRSTNIEDIRGKSYELIVSAGVSSLKWKANQEPEADRQAILKLMDALRHVKARTFVLISTIDVYDNPVGVDEGSAIAPEPDDAVRPQPLGTGAVRARTLCVDDHTTSEPVRPGT